MKAQVISSIQCNICGNAITKCDECDDLFVDGETIECKLYTHYCKMCRNPTEVMNG